VEQNGVDDALVLERDLRRRTRQGEDDMEIRHGQQFRLACLKPCGACQSLALGAVAVATRVVGTADQSAIATLFDVPAERGCAAGFDCCHDTPLDPAEMRAMTTAERSTVAAEDLRHLQRRAHHHRSGRRRHLQMQAVQRAWRATDRAGRDLCVTRRRVDVAMAEERLDDADVGATFQ
jgi:hypothetical protein